MLPFIDQKPKCGSGAEVVHLLLSVCGVRVPRLGLGVRVKRTVRFQEVVEITGCGGRAENQPSWQQFPRGRPGEKYLDPRGAGPGEQGSRPRVSVAVETLVKPDNIFSIRPGLARRKGSGRLPPKSLASIRQETARNQARIRQELDTPGCIVSGAATSAALDRARCSGCQHSREPGQRGTVGVYAAHRQGSPCRPPPQHTRG